MANVQNLKPIKKGDLSKEEAKKRGSIGGKKSAEARRERKLIKDRILERIGEADWDTMIDNLIDRAKDNPKDFEILRDTIGEKPIDKIQVAEIDQSVIDEVEAMVLGDEVEEADI